MINKFFDFLLPYSTHSYIVMFVLLIACGLGLPVPEDVILVTSGIFVGEEIINLKTTIFLCMTGVLMGDSIIFFLGKFFGERIIHSKIISKFVNLKRHKKRVDSVVKKYGTKIIFMARFMPGFRAPTYFFMGTFKKPYLVFLSIDFFAAAISVPVWIYFGVFFHDNLPLLEEQIKKLRTGIYITVIFIILLFVAGYFIKKRLLKVLNTK